MAQLYKKRPIEVEAVQWTGDNQNEIWEFTTAEFFVGPTDEGPDDLSAPSPARLYVAANDAWLTLEVGEWVLADVKGFYPCKADVFAATYDKVEANSDVCTCGHSRGDHIYEEGACRPGFECAQKCQRFVAA